eukprot:5918159-Amphidinium_carterae.2
MSYACHIGVPSHHNCWRGILVPHNGVDCGDCPLDLLVVFLSSGTIPSGTAMPQSVRKKPRACTLLKT